MRASRTAPAGPAATPAVPPAAPSTVAPAGAPAGVTAAATLGLLAAWGLHDMEEIATMGRWARERVPVLRARHPWVPDRVWDRLGSVDGREFATAVAVVAVVVGAAAADGHRTGGRSAFYQASLNAFGLHGLVHVAQAAATRGYTPAW
ncbi:HXXEE domain-containing protein [Streptomyces sp. NPDC007369]|uniref:HXXEE domain-containing protein n=1 Tax=Streptomyces sp. NPDC007369 TaxID=3154589 RepID=UPI0033D1BAE4